MENGRMRFTVWGKPIAQARPKFFTRKSKGGKVYAGAYSPQATEAGRFAIAIQGQLPAGWEPIEGPIAISAFFGMPIPASASKKNRLAMEIGEVYPDKKPDLDNLIKFAKDCMTGIVWRDDAQIVEIRFAMKLYVPNPRTTIEVEKIEMGGLKWIGRVTGEDAPVVKNQSPVSAQNAERSLS